MIENGADPNACDNARRSPLEVAVEIENYAAAAAIARKGGKAVHLKFQDGASEGFTLVRGCSVSLVVLKFRILCLLIRHSFDIERKRPRAFIEISRGEV